MINLCIKKKRVSSDYILVIYFVLAIKMLLTWHFIHVFTYTMYFKCLYDIL